MKFKKKLRQPDLKQVFNYAVWLLARQNYTQKKLLEKFKTRFLPDAALFTAALEKLTKLGFQSDQNSAEAFVRSHADWGIRRLKLELQKRGITADLIQAVLPSAETEVERCRFVLSRKLKNQALPKDYKAQQRLAAFLARKGFDFEVIKRVLSL